MTRNDELLLNSDNLFQFSSWAEFIELAQAADPIIILPSGKFWISRFELNNHLRVCSKGNVLTGHQTATVELTNGHLRLHCLFSKGENNSVVGKVASASYESKD